MTRKNKIIIVSSAISILLSACAAMSDEPQNDVSDAERIIADKVSVASDAMQEYVAILNERNAHISLRQAQITEDQLDIDFYGKPQELLKALAIRYGYQYVEIGNWVDIKPINILANKMAAIEVLRNIGYQVNNQADVILDIPNKTIRLSYKPVKTSR